ncbi:ADP-ribosylglycohydrolase family protein [Pseudonocardia oceani]|uniref:ADP-ribosylglycohydrolase family protein n=1 Tax=Pseudonocardia oceani TaxID=2792013 RepID=A0ABS6UEP7_9PSEU|nr:ADP-ribosylglycohydrolase family protein [Pseudonocardia oceani]MBW0123241.1 ADP-ribosylglycohydrolase family protein [Pseudonocardia oceani]MBW0130720.1 ADP-ribosylglycohydrolase family protein [Pseudonocardia oceani]
MSTVDRRAGVLLGAACGDALGVPYELGSRALGERAEMLGGGLGGYAPGQWSDDTEMACVIARVPGDLRTPEALDDVAAGFLDWFAAGPADVGTQTAAVLGALRGTPRAGAAARMRERAAAVHAATGRSAGNGSLMRTAPVALRGTGVVEAARAVSALTHHDPVAGDACALWCLAIDHAVRAGELDVRVGLPHVDPAWEGWIAEAERSDPSAFASTNGWVVAALQGAWSAVVGATGLVDGLQAAVRGGGDTDTVAAIAGALLGARFGASAVLGEWRRVVHGWPGWTGEDLVGWAGNA